MAGIVTTYNYRMLMIISDHFQEWLKLEKALKKAGFISSISESSEAVSILASLSPDLLVIDHPLPGSEGMDIYREILTLQEEREIPALLVTDPAYSGQVELLVQEKPVNVLSRPIEAEALVSLLKSMIRGAGELRSRTELMVRVDDQLVMLKEAVDALPIGITLKDTNGRIIYSNPTEAAMHGFTVDELIGRQARAFAKRSMKKIVTNLLEEKGIWSRESTNVRKDGTEFPVQLTSIAVKSANRNVGIVTICEDISERKETEEKIYLLAHMDALTGLPNRRLFHDRLDHALARARREGRKICLAYLDLDNFKEINDTYGHDFGDKLLQGVAARMSAIMRESDTLARLGGDEFIVILDSVKGEDNFTTAAQRMLSIFTPPFEINGRQINTSASIGIAIFPDDAEEGDMLLKAADAAMYHVKEEGSCGFHFFSTEMHDRIMRRISIENALKKGLAKGEFFLLYQPQWDVKSARIIGTEALIRWQSSDFGLMLPAEFISLIEDSGLIFSIGEWVLRTACLEAKNWAAAGHPNLNVSVNISRKQLKQPDFLDVIAGILGNSGVNPGTIELEFTENMIMEHTEKTIDTLHALKRMGLQLSIDNFGAGYSSLNYLKNFPIDRIKIDRSFIADLCGNDDAIILKAIVSIANALKMKVIVEGVETEAQLKFLEELGCYEVQGYLLGKPMPANELTKLLQREGG